MTQVKFRRKTFSTGTSSVVTLPEEIRTFLDIKDGDEIEMMPETGKHGKFISLWKV